MLVMTIDPAGRRCGIGDCPQAATVHVAFGEWGEVQASLCGRHKPTVEQALRRGVVATYWKIHGNYPHEIASQLTHMTGHTIRESTILADLEWLGLTEAHRAAEARIDTAVSLGEAGPNVVALRRAQ
jgi:hypothetical protein